MAGLGGRRALELLAQGLVEVLAEDRQVQQQQTNLQQQAFQAGLAAAGVLVQPQQQGANVRPLRALPPQVQQQLQQAALQQLPMQMMVGLPGMGQFAAADSMTGQAVSPGPTAAAAATPAATPIVEEMHSPGAPDHLMATSKSKPSPPQTPRNAEAAEVVSSRVATSAAAAAVPMVGPEPGDVRANESEVPPAPAPTTERPAAGAPPVGPAPTTEGRAGPAAPPVPPATVTERQGVREVSLSRSDTSPGETVSASVVTAPRYRREEGRRSIASTTASRGGSDAMTVASSPAAGTTRRERRDAPLDSVDSAPAGRAPGQGFEVLKSDVLNSFHSCINA